MLLILQQLAICKCSDALRRSTQKLTFGCPPIAHRLLTVKTQRMWLRSTSIRSQQGPLSHCQRQLG